jgi:SNF2 family DNA or RNA helicase
MSKVTLSKVGNRIHADIPYNNGAGVHEAKAVPGARPKYDKSRFVCWTYPLAISTCRQLREQFGARLQITEDLADWARKAMASEQTQIHLRSATDVGLQHVPAVAPRLAEAMENRPFQKVGASFIANGRTVLIADEPGLGKTLETLAGLVETGAKRVLVFAKKKAAETVWGAEVPRWLGDKAEVYVATGDLNKGQRDKVLDEFIRAAGWGLLEEEVDLPKLRIVVCNIEMARQKKGEAPKFPQLFLDEWDAIVVDESHKALIGKHVMSNNITQTRYGMMKLPLKPGGLKVALSGTPFRGKSQNAWGTLNWLRPDVFTSYWRWVEEYFTVDSGYGGSRIVQGIREDREAAYDQMIAPYLLRRTKAEVAKDMPPRQYGGTPLSSGDPHSTIGVWLDMTPAQAKHYAEIVKNGETKLASGDLTANGHLAELTRMKQFASCSWDIEPDGRLNARQPSNKYDWLLEFIQEREAAGLKVVVASQFTRLLNAFSCWLEADGVASYLLTGETSEKRVAAIVGAFNDPSDPVPAVLINTMAGGESINLDACADDVVFIDETFIPDDQEQVENRIHRMSRIHQVNVWYLRSRETVDEEICVITGAREGAVKSRLDGSRGVQIFRNLMGHFDVED